MEKIKKEESNKLIIDKIKLWQIIIGIMTGLINGLFGGGGGMILVPMLIKFLKLEQKNAHATAILIILPLSILSCLIYIIFGKMKWSLAFPITLGVVIGGVIGAFLLKKISNKVLGLVFYLLMIFAGAKMLF